MYEHSFPDLRYKKTMQLVSEFISPEEKILDLGVLNPFTSILTEHGFKAVNTDQTDLDIHPEMLRSYEADAVLALEILEHLVSPFPLLKNLPGKKLIATVPLRLWFASAYRNDKNPRDCHYHEFEDWQFDWLVNKSGWKIKHREKWIIPTKIRGIRPILRNFVPRIYAVYAER